MNLNDDAMDELEQLLLDVVYDNPNPRDLNLDLLLDVLHEVERAQEAKRLGQLTDFEPR